MKKTIMEFCSIKPVRISSIGPVKHSKEDKRENWINYFKLPSAYEPIFKECTGTRANKKILERLNLTSMIINRLIRIRNNVYIGTLL